MCYNGTYVIDHKRECEVFVRGSKHRETDESTTPKPECFYRFEVFGTPNENQSTSFSSWLLKLVWEFSGIISEQ